MYLYKALTGVVPFSDKPPHAAALAIVDGERPPRPTHPALTDGLWALAQQCCGVRLIDPGVLRQHRIYNDRDQGRLSFPK